MHSLHRLWATLITLSLPIAYRKSDRGAGFIEYGAIIVFVALVAGVIMTSGLENRIVNGMTSAIDRIFRSE
ncbi:MULTISPECIES: hypothetical protein [unclassified Nocardiopsis]|uniref:hypothetical protein n=1 Tax=unclassified Nocardiopsis TaxID=2649073 RepID=UPI0033D16549